MVSHSSSVRLWASLAGAAIMTHAALFLALHFLEPEVSPLSGIISDYQATPSAWVVRVSFLVFALTWGALGIGLPGTGKGSRLLTVGRFLFLLAAIAMVLGAVYPASADPRTGSGLARIQNLVARPGLFLGVLFVSLGLRRIEHWSDLAPALVWIAGVSAALLLVTIGLFLERGFGGLGQRAIFVLLYVWVILVARRMVVVESPAPA